jgi:membrane-associated phospholipid phosphatase
VATNNAGLLFSFAVVALFSVAGYHFFDVPVAVFCRELGDGVQELFELVSKFGDSTLYLLGTAGIFVFCRFARPKPLLANRALFCFASLAISGIVTMFIKMIFGRFRPRMYFSEGLYGLNLLRPSEDMNSFPSGHAATALSFSLALSLLFPTYRFPLVCIGLLVAVSRTITTAHFLSDTVAGAWIGIVTVVLLHREISRRGKADSFGLKG